MTNTIDITLYIEPKPLKRARHSKRGSFIATYYDKQTLQEMDNLKYAIINTLDDEHREIIVSHMANAHNSLKIALKLEFGFVIPSSYSMKRQRTLKYQAHTNNIDLDNLVKNVLDRGNGIVWSDDKYIYDIHARKVWADINYIKLSITYESTQ